MKRMNIFLVLVLLIIVGAVLGAMYVFQLSSSEGTTMRNQQDITSKLLSATSSDGLVWKKTNQIVADKAKTPGALFDGIYMRIYFIRKGVPMVALSQDGSNWQEKKVSVSNLPRGMVVLDPEVVLLADRNYRMYYYEHPRAKGLPLSIQGDFTIAYASSTDGINFQREETAFIYERVMDPDVIQMENVWRMFVSQDGKTIGAISYDDGKSFTFEQYVSRTRFISTTLAVPGGYRMYYHVKEGNTRKTYSAFSTDGKNWKEDPGVRIEAGEEGSLDEGGPGSPAVLRDSNGVYWLFYTTSVG